MECILHVRLCIKHSFNFDNYFKRFLYSHFIDENNKAWEAIAQSHIVEVDRLAKLLKISVLACLNCRELS